MNFLKNYKNYEIYLTFGFLALNVTNGVFRLSTTGVTLGGFADGVANSRAVRVVAFPAALRMALQEIKLKRIFMINFSCYF